MNIEIDGEYSIEDKSQEVVIYCTDAPGIQPVHGRVGNELVKWDKYGYFFPSKRPHQFNLIPKPETVSGWVNVYNDLLITGMYDTKERALEAAGRPGHYINTIFIEAAQEVDHE